MKRQLLEIKVDEVSLVDDPAVQEDFILIKNQNGEAASTGTDKQEPGATSTQPNPAGTEGGTGANMPVHQALLDEMLLAIANAGKQIWEKAPTLDITDKEAMKDFRSKIWAIEDLCYQLSGMKDVMALAKAASELAGKGDAAGAVDKVAKLLKTFGESKFFKAEASTQDGTNAFPASQRVNAKMLDEKQVARLVEGLMIVAEVLQGVDAKMLSGMLQGLLGQGKPEGSATTPTEQAGGMAGTEEEKAGKAADAAEFAALKAELETLNKKYTKLEKANAERSGTIQPPNGLRTEVNPQPSAKKAVVWEEDLAAARD